jgi:hypothetical protein
VPRLATRYDPLPAPTRHALAPDVAQS